MNKALVDVKRDWEDLEGRLNAASKKAGDMKKALDTLEEKIQPIEETCVAAEKGLDECAVFGTDVPAGDKEIERLEVPDMLCVQLLKSLSFLDIAGPRMDCYKHRLYLL